MATTGDFEERRGLEKDWRNFYPFHQESGENSPPVSGDIINWSLLVTAAKKAYIEFAAGEEN